MKEKFHAWFRRHPVIAQLVAGLITGLSYGLVITGAGIGLFLALEALEVHLCH